MKKNEQMSIWFLGQTDEGHLLSQMKVTFVPATFWLGEVTLWLGEVTFG